MADAVRYEADPATRIATITLDRPDNRNSMTAELLDAFARATAAAGADAGLRCVIVTGTGQSFSAGADFRSAAPSSGDRPLDERTYALYEPFLSVLDLEVPVIAACNGHAVGGGFGLALLCDIRIGARGARYGANFTRLGLHPGMAISYLLPRLVGASRAAELLFTGRLVDGDEAERIGILSSAVDADQVMPRALELAGAIAASAPLAVRMTKQSLYRALGWDPRAGALAEAFAQAHTLATADAAEGIAALLEKRDPRFVGR
jgi:enoyl-CoA hydratase/carnithine racemase